MSDGSAVVANAYERDLLVIMDDPSVCSMLGWGEVPSAFSGEDRAQFTVLRFPYREGGAMAAEPGCRQ